MSKEIKIDEIITASTQRDKGDSKGAKMKDANSSDKSTQTKGAEKFNNAGNATGMPGDFSEIFNNPEMVEMFSSGKIPGFGKLPLKQRIMFRLMGLFGTNKGKSFLRKRWWPLWAIVILLFGGVILALGLIYLVYRLLKAILNPYIQIFTRKG